MGDLTSQIIWKQAWSPDAESLLRLALASQYCSIRELSSQQWEASTATIGGVRDYMTSYLAPASHSWSSLMLHLNSLVAAPVTSELSRLTTGPAIAMLEYNQEAWGYCLYERGQLVDTFWNLPDVVDTSPDECLGNVITLARVFDISPESIAPYIRHVTENDYKIKASTDDEFTLGDHWVRVDFMRHLGISYPDPGQVAGGRHVLIEEVGQ